MTREEAIEWIEGLRDGWNDTTNVTACNMAIKALEQKPCEDCISRVAVLTEVDKYMCGVPFEKGLDEVIKELPSVTPQPNTGRWIFDEILDKHYYCSECKSMGVDYWDFCPNCGAKMEVEE